MTRRVGPLLLAFVLTIGLLAPPAVAQQADPVAALFREAYQILRDSALAQPTSDTLLQGADAGLRQLLRERGQSPTLLGTFSLTGDERVDLSAMLSRIDQAHAATDATRIQAVYAAIAGMVAALRDPNSAFFQPDAFAQFMRRTRGDDFVGIGIVIEDRGGQTVITDVLDNSPASESGLRGGDVILAVDGVSTAGMALEQVSQMIRGTEGTPVTLAIQRPGIFDPLSITLTRRRIQSRVVITRLLPSGMGYLRLMQFIRGADAMVAEGLRTLLEQDVRGIILDLRGNPGGLLDVSVNIASHFLQQGDVVTLDTGRGLPTAYAVRPRAPKYAGPLVVLVDRGSASASEVVAGALQDAGIRLVGVRTYGKATVQAVYQLRDGSGLRVTVSRYLTPSGRDIDGRGLSPDIEVSSGGVPIGSPEDAPLNRAVAMLQQSAGQPSPVITRPAPVMVDDALPVGVGP
jgi:carboxyl-terminal processing protease